MESRAVDYFPLPETPGLRRAVWWCTSKKNDDSKCRIPIWIAFALTLGIFFWQLFEGVL